MTDRRTLADSPDSDSFAKVIQKISTVAASGVDWIQIREKDLSAKKLASLTREALKAAEWHRLQPVDAPNWSSQQQDASRAAKRTRVIVNDRLDVAIAERAGGVHLGENSIPPADARRLIASAQQKGVLAEHFFLGVSCHSLESAKSAEADANYIFFGPIFPTPSKAQYGAPQGLARLAEVCRAVSIPVLAIGGITPDNAASCFNSGAAGIAAIRLFQDSLDLPTVAQRLLQTHRK